MKDSIFLGKNQIAKSAKIVGSQIENCKIGEKVEIANSVIRNSEIKSGAQIGPFAHIRDGSVIEENVRIGNFVEIKKSVIGQNTKIAHMSYVGDAVIGKDCNIGAGVIFCNFDGKNKHKTVVGNRVFVGSNCNLIAPLEIASNCFVASGTTVTHSIPQNTNIIGRQKQQKFEFENPFLPKKPKFFGTDGIRGVWGANLNPALIEEIANAVCLVGAKKVVIGKDTRPSGEEIINQLKKFFETHGVEVVDAGIVSTPVLAFATRMKKACFGIMVTASHNPAEQNGIKIFDGSGQKISKAAQNELEQIFFSGQQAAIAQSFKSKTLIDLKEKYQCFVKSYVKGSLCGLSVVLDCANGSAAFFAPQIFQALGAKVVSINTKGKINQNCGALFPEVIKKAVKAHQSDLGFAFDGDADRVVAVSAEGQIFDGDEILWILASCFQKKGLLAKPEVVGTVVTNQGIKEKLEQIGIKTHLVDVGDSNVVQKMCQHGLCLGAEQSGHVAIGGQNVVVDGILTALILAKVYLKDKMLFAQVKKKHGWVQVHKNLEIEIEEAKLKKIVSDFQACCKGIRIVARKSGTENKIRLLVESKNHGLCKIIMNLLIKQLKG